MGTGFFMEWKFHQNGIIISYWPIPDRPKRQLQLTSISMTRHAQPAPLCAQPAHGPARIYVSRVLLSDECPPTCSTGSLAGSVCD